MIKIFLSIISLCIFLSAAPYEYPTKCPQWEHGQIVYYNGIQQNVNGSTPPLEFCWDATRIEGLGLVSVNGTLYQSLFENLVSNESLFYWFANNIHYVYGEDYIGLYVKVLVTGYEQKTPIVWLGTTTATLVSKRDILSPSGNLWNGYEYTFFIRKMLKIIISRMLSS